MTILAARTTPAPTQAPAGTQTPAGAQTPTPAGTPKPAAGRSTAAVDSTGTGATPVLCLQGSEGVGKTSLPHFLARALGRVVAQVNCGEPADARALLGDPWTGPDRVIQELRRVGSRSPVFVLDELDRDDLPAATLELFAPRSARPSATAASISASICLMCSSWRPPTRLRSAPPMLYERLAVMEVPGYTPDEKCVIAVEHLSPPAVRLHGPVSDDMDVTDDARRSVIRDYA